MMFTKVVHSKSATLTGLNKAPPIATCLVVSTSLLAAGVLTYQCFQYTMQYPTHNHKVGLQTSYTWDCNAYKWVISLFTKREFLKTNHTMKSRKLLPRSCRCRGRRRFHRGGFGGTVVARASSCEKTRLVSTQFEQKKCSSKVGSFPPKIIYRAKSLLYIPPSKLMK